MRNQFYVKSAARSLRREEVKQSVDLVKYLHKVENDQKLKVRLASLGFTLNKILIHIQ